MIELMEETANMLRGMCMDPRIPQDTKEALWSRVRKLDAVTEAAEDDAASDQADFQDAQRFRWLAERTAATGLERWVHPFQFLAEAVDARMKSGATSCD